jgi:hypothetical protein
VNHFANGRHEDRPPQKGPCMRPLIGAMVLTGDPEPYLPEVPDCPSCGQKHVLRVEEVSPDDAGRGPAPEDTVRIPAAELHQMLDHLEAHGQHEYARRVRRELPAPA